MPYSLLRSRIVHLAVGIFAPVLTACGEFGQSGTVVSDSAGVRVIANPPVADVRNQVFLADSPDVVLGGIRGNLEEEFLSRSGYLTAVRGSDGDLYAHDGTHVKHFDASGRLLAVVGRDGDGPGEFRDIQGLCPFHGDSLLVADLRGRVTIVGPASTIVRDYAPSGWVVPDACFSDGSVLVAGSTTRDPTSSSASTQFDIVSSTGEILGRMPPLPASVFSPVYRQVSYEIHNDELYVGDPIEMAVKVYDRAGTLLRIVRTRDEPEPLDQDELPGPLPEAAEGSGTSGTRIGVPAGARRPMFSAMRVDRQGRIWLQTQEYRGSDERWIVFARDGSILAQLTMIPDRSALPPPTEPWSGRRIVSFGVDEVIVLDEDEMGAPRFSVYNVIGLDQEGAS